MSRCLISLASLLAVVIAPASVLAQAAEVVKTNPTKVFMHYMPWFETPDTLGGNNWGYHWKFNNRNPNLVDETGKRQIASHYYPLIGPYASRDADVIEYHLLLMKLSGVDGLLIDWYGQQGTNGDINNLLTSSNAVVDRVDNVGLDFGVVMEDRFSANLNQGKANVAYLRDHYFNQPNYIRLGAEQKPLLPVFGPITFQQESDWTQVLAQAGEPVDLLTLWYESADAGSNAAGEYAWIYEDAAQDNHLTHQRNFYRIRAPQQGVAGGVAYPGFDDYYVEGGVGNVVPFEIPHDGGQTLDALLSLATTYANNVDFVQLATFNDFGEGTMFEPTIETGFEYLKKVQQFTGVAYGEEELRLVHRLYLARKKYAGDAAIEGELDTVSDLLTNLQIGQAEAALEAVAPRGDFDGDGDVDLNDYGVWSASLGSQLALYGGGADGNQDGRVDAADYTVWRDSLALRNAALISVPEPATPALAALATGAALFSRR
ncbi:glycoside hydrolase family 71/99-like protein [Botrimarina colliarenosi]|nr:glycoside hydrolase family 71/99-like protein [Botrimarina colliarenosi]